MKAARLHPWHPRFNFFSRNKEFWQKTMNARPDGARRILLLVQQPRGDHDVCINRPERNLNPLGYPNSPLLGLPHRILIANQDGGSNFVTKFQNAVLRISAQNEANFAHRKIFRNVWNASSEKTIMAKISVGIKRHRREENHDRLA